MKVLAINDRGELTYCSAPPELRGKGRCNHICHQKENENMTEFMQKANEILEERNNPINKDIKIRNDNKYNVTENDGLSYLICNGLQEKFKKDGNYIKVDQEKHTNALSEEMVSQFLDLTNLEHAHYESKSFFISEHDGNKNCIVSPSFYDEENESLRTIRDIMNNEEYCNYKNKEDIQEQFDYLVNFIEKKTNIPNVKSYLLKTLSLDVLVGNPDRHLNNIAIIYSDETSEARFAPAFDHGLSLLSNFELFPLEDDLDENIYKIPMSTFKSNFADEYIDLIGDNVSSRDDILQIDEDAFYKWIDNYKNPLYKDEYVERAKKMLKQQVEDLKGDIWVPLKKTKA